MVFEKINLLSHDDLQRFRNIILAHLNESVGLGLTSLADYHHKVSEVAHSFVIAKKSARVLGPASVKEVLQLDSFSSLLTRFSGFGLSSVVTEGGEVNTPEIYFRLVRPYSASDVGPPHCDRWFHLGAGLNYKDCVTFKVWIAIVTEPGLSGLQFFPHANSSALRWSYEDGRMDCDPTQPSLGAPDFPSVVPGDALVFSCDTLHQGVLNRGSLTRVSVELTFVPNSFS